MEGIGGNGSVTGVCLPSTNTRNVLDMLYPLGCHLTVTFSGLLIIIVVKLKSSPYWNKFKLRLV